jgi:Domain of unknown function (DUF4281)
MTTMPALIFKLSNLLALLMWLALIASPPKRTWTFLLWRIAGRIVPLLFSVLYVALLVVYWSNEGGFGSIEQVQALFKNPGLLTAGWVHYLAWDLWLGVWIASRAAQLNISHWLIVPVLLLTLMFGPAGLLAFVLLRAVLKRESLTLLPPQG